MKSKLFFTQVKKKNLLKLFFTLLRSGIVAYDFKTEKKKGYMFLRLDFLAYNDMYNGL